MTRDPLYKEILTRLDGDLDGELFEQAARDLFRDIYPKLFSMSGGNDGGYDGGISVEDGVMPMCHTVDKKGPRQNFRKNIQRYLIEHPEGPKRAIVVTPRKMSASRKRNLIRDAKSEFNVRIDGIYSQEDIANRLYHNSHWLEELLGLSGRAPALSALPRRLREERPPLIGRDDDIAWLRQRLSLTGEAGDTLVIGQPGSGKTYLHEYLAKTDGVLFAVDSDRGRLADAIRDQEPVAIVVDDAHENQGMLHELRDLRRQINAHYAIHANAWPSFEIGLKDEMGLADDAVRTIRLLTRPTVKQLVNSLGLHGPEQLIGLILDQAEGKPGLAAALTSATFRGQVEQVWSGEAVAGRLLDSRDAFRNRRIRQVLACFALAGNTGAKIDDVAEFLRMSPAQVSEDITNLAAGGIVDEAIRHTSSRPSISVRPPMLRGWLVYDAFYRGPARLDPSTWIQKLAEQGIMIEALHILMDAKARGADIPERELVNLIREVQRPNYQSKKLWEHFAFLSSYATELILEEEPSAIVHALPGLLYHHPEKALKAALMLSTKAANNILTESFTNPIKDWLQGDSPGDNSCKERRLLTIRLFCDMSEYLSDTKVAPHLVWLLKEAMHPAINTARTSPIDSMSFIVTHGLLPITILESLSSAWPQVFEVIKKSNSIPDNLCQLIEAWCSPGLHRRTGQVQAKEKTLMSETATQMLQDMLTIPACGRAARTWAKSLARKMRLDIEVSVDRNFDRLFGREDYHEDWKTRQARRKLMFERLAEEYLCCDPIDAMTELAAMEHEAKEFKGLPGHERNTFYWELGTRAERPQEWINAAEQSGLPVDKLQVLFNSVWHRGVDEPEIWLRKLLTHDTYQSMAAERILSLPNPEADLLDKAISTLAKITHYSDQEAFYIAHLSPSVKAIRSLLQHPNRLMRIAAAFAEWLVTPEKIIREELVALWREVILEVRTEDQYLLGEILASDPELAFDWGLARITASGDESEYPGYLWEYATTFDQITPLIGIEKRWQLLDLIDNTMSSDKVIVRLIGDNPELMRRWLIKHRGTGEYHEFLALTPLRRKVDVTWVAFAETALDVGFSVQDITGQIGRGDSSSSGSRSSMFRDLLDAMKPFADHTNPRIREVILRGIVWAEREMTREIDNEYQLAVRGRR